MTRKQKKRLIKICAATVLLIAVSCLPIQNPVLRFALYLLPYLTVGFDVLWTAVRHILHGQVFDEQFLMSVATLGAFALGENREAVAVMLLYQVGELFQSIAVGKSRRNIAALMEIRPESAVVLREGEEMTVSPEEVAVGETVLIRPGEKIPLDGVIIAGNTAIDAAALTGESLPLEKQPGDRVISGSVNLTGLIEVKTESIYADSMVAKILDLVENASSKKAKTETFITRFAKYYTPCVVGAALLLAVIPPLFVGGFAGWLRRALIFLVVSCPCALVISVPLSFFGGIGGASKKGILIKGSRQLEQLAAADTFVFDKTGTLTKGNFVVTEVLPVGMSEEELLCLAAMAESHSAHPIARSVTRAYPEPFDRERIREMTEHPGQGIEAVIDGRRVFAGNARLMREIGITPAEPSVAGTAIYLARDGQYCGCLVITDEIKEDAPAAIAALQKLGIRKTVMLTGDRREIAQYVGDALQITQIRAELFPADKVNAIEELIAGGAKPAFTGDGINDAPVLARADVSIAMGALGSDAAIEAADVVLMDDKLSGVPAAVKIARKTMRIARQNVVFALSVKAAVLLLATLGFANMWIAIFADVGVAVLAILNAMRTMR